MKNELSLAVRRIASEKDIPEESIVEILTAAMVAAYKKDFPEAHGVEVTVHPETEELRVFALKEVVMMVEENMGSTQVSYLIAKAYDPNAEVGTEVLVDVTPKEFGRIAAQTAKQVVMQKLREIERELIFKEFNGKVGEIISGQIRKVESGMVIVNVGRTDAFIPYRHQIPGERYHSGQRIRALLLEVNQTTKGPSLILSRSHEDFIRRLFELEIPEIYGGSVEIKAIAREAGHRTKISVSARQEGIDPVGSCVGQRGSRIQVIMAELGNEKIDIIAHDADPAISIANSLKPAQITKVVLDRQNQSAVVVVAEDQLSLAIGRSGQNVRLASKLVDWNLDVKSPEESRDLIAAIEERSTESDEELRGVLEGSTLITEEDEEADYETPSFALTDINGIGPKLAETLIDFGYETIEDIANESIEALSEIKGISKDKAQKILTNAKTLLGE